MDKLRLKEARRAFLSADASLIVFFNLQIQTELQ